MFFVEIDKKATAYVSGVDRQNVDRFWFPCVNRMNSEQWTVKTVHNVIYLWRMTLVWSCGLFILYFSFDIKE